MIQGFITAKHILIHPMTMIAVLGLAGYFVMLTRCLDGRKHCFLELMYEVRMKQGKAS